MSATRQATRGARRASRKVQDSSEEIGRTGARARDQAEDVAEGASAQGRGLLDVASGGEKEPSRQTQTFRQELAAIVREAAIEVLAPVARQATKYAAKYAVQRGPKLAQETLMPRLKETLGSIQDAGGAGAFAKDALGAGGGVLSRLGGSEDEEDAPGAWESAKAPVEEQVDVAVGLQDAYEYFQGFEQRVHFMSDHEQVEEVPNERIVWESTNGLEAICVITFHELAERLTRVMVTYEAHPHGLQKATSALRLRRRVIRGDLLRFKSLVEVHPDEADDLYDESDEQEPRDGAPELDEESELEEEEDEEEVDEPARPKPRRRSESSPVRRRQDKASPREQSSRRAPAQTGKASAPSRTGSAQPRTRTVRGGSGESGSSSGGRRQSQPASNARASRTSAKG